MRKRPLVFIKLGGSVITHKETPNSLRADVLKRLIKEVCRARLEQPEKIFVVGHGHGSFGHVPAAQYKTMDGFIEKESQFGMAKVIESVTELNQIVVKEFLDNKVPAVPFFIRDVVLTNSRKATQNFLETFAQYLESGMFPVTCGDVLLDTKQGCTIWSTEEVLSFLARQFLEKKWQVEQMIHVTESDGVLGEDGKTMPHIDKEKIQEIEKVITPTKGVDVSGGMLLKVTQSAEMAKLGIQSKILSGLRANNLYNVLSGKKWIGTKIS